MAALTRVSPSTSLYPPTTPVQLRDFLLWVSAGHEKNDDGGLVLKRNLTTTERESLKARASELLPWLESSTHSKIKDAITRTFLGFSSTPMSATEAAVVATQYTLVMAKNNLPAWAVERACLRFASGDVRPEEVGAKSLDSNYRPTTAQLRTIAAEFVQPVQEEAHRIALTLKGSAPRHEISEEARAEGDGKIEAWRMEKGIRDKETAEEERERRALARQRDEEDEERRMRLVRKEYTDAGVEPPEAKHGVIPSLAMLLTLGCTIIETPGGKRTLSIPPNPFANYVPETPKTKPVQDTMAIGLKQAAHAAVEIADKTRRERRNAR